MTNSHKRGFFRTSQAYYAPVFMPVLQQRTPQVTEDFSLGLYASGGGTKGEMRMEWVRLEAGKPSCAKLTCFDDAFAALAGFQDVIDALARRGEGITPDEFSSLLLSLGFEDMTPRERVGD